MAISNVNTSLTPSSQDALSAVAASSTPAASNNTNNWAGQQQASTVVSISKQGQALSRSGNTNQSQQASQSQNAAYNNPTNPSAENREGHLQEAAKKPGIQLLEAEKNNTPSQGSRVNTFV